MKMAKKFRGHPIQDLEISKDGVLRFRPNAIVRFLLDSHPSANLNTLAMMPFSDEDRAQLAQLIGYSVNGYLELSYAAKREKVEALEEKHGPAAEALKRYVTKGQ